MKSVPEQLTDIYYKYEDWHVFKMPYDKALRYHTNRIKNGEIQVYLENGEVLGYCARHFVLNVCFIDNAWIKDIERRGKVFKSLHKQFYDTLPKNITHVMGNKKNKLDRLKISKWRFNHG